MDRVWSMCPVGSVYPETAHWTYRRGVETLSCCFLHWFGGLGLDLTLFLMDSKKLDTSSLPAFYRSMFSVWTLLKKQRQEQADSLYWLLQDPFCPDCSTLQESLLWGMWWIWRDLGWMIRLDWLLSWVINQLLKLW